VDAAQVNSGGLAWLGGLALLVAAGSAHAQTYTRCVEPSGAVYLTDGALPTGIECVVRVTKELVESPMPIEKRAPAAPGQRALWMADSSGTILVRTYQREARAGPAGTRGRWPLRSDPHST